MVGEPAWDMTTRQVVPLLHRSATVDSMRTVARSAATVAAILVGAVLSMSMSMKMLQFQSCAWACALRRRTVKRRSVPLVTGITRLGSLGAM